MGRKKFLAVAIDTDDKLSSPALEPANRAVDSLVKNDVVDLNKKS